jgi:prevent-host-death family protein
MTVVPLGDAHDRLSEYVTEVERTDERITITRGGRPAAVLVSVDGLASRYSRRPWRSSALQVPSRRSRRVLPMLRQTRFVDGTEIKARHSLV